MSRPHFRVYTSAFALSALVLLPGGRTAAAQTVAQTTPSAVAFSPLAVGTVSAPQTVTVPVRTAGAAVPPTVSSEFRIVPGGTCAAQQTYAVGDTCTVSVVFTPQVPGVVAGVVLLPGSHGQVLGTSRISGTALGSAAAFTPGVVQPLALSGQAGDSFTALTSSLNGQAYFADRTSGQVLRFDSLTGVTGTVASLPLGSNPVTGLAADVDGTLYLLRSTGKVSRFDPFAGTLSQVDLSSAPGIASTGPVAIAVDPAGRLLIASTTVIDRFQDGVWTTLSNAAPCADPASPCGDGQTAVNAQFVGIRALAVDATGNLFIADAAASRIRRIDAVSSLVSTVAGTGTACAHVPCGENGAAGSAQLGTISSLAVDALGNLYFSEASSGLRRIDAASGTLNSVLPAAEARFRTGAVATAALRDGSVLLLSATDPSTIGQFTATTSALAFAQTAVGHTSTDSVQTVTLTNLGNAPLTLSPPAAGTNPSTTADFPLSSTQTCPQLSSSSAAQSLAPGTSCSLQVKFTPTIAGTVSSRVVLTESSPAAPAAHSIAVQGIAAAPPTAQAAIALISLPNAPVYGQPVSLNVAVYDPNHAGPTPTGTVIFTEGVNTLASVAVSGGTATYTITLPSPGSHTYSVSYSGDTNYAPSSQNTSVNVTVARAASVYTYSLPSYTFGQNVRVNYVLSGQYSGTGIALPSGVVTYTLYDSSGNVVTSGTSPYAARVNSIDENAQLGLLHGGSYVLRLNYPGDTNFLPLQQDLPFTVFPVGQTIVFDPIATPVTYGVAPISLSATAYSNAAVPAGTSPTPSGLPVTFSVLSGPGTIVNNQLVITGPGTIVVAADQAGNSDYAAAPRVTQTVISVRPVARLVWNTPSPIIVGTALGPNQLNAVASDPNGQPLAGTYTYTPAAGTVLPVGPATLNVTFVPDDTQHYGNASLTASVVLTVRDLTTATINFAGGSTAFGGGVGSALNATATANGAVIPGTFVYTTGSATLSASTSLPVGTYAVLATFTPADATTYRGGAATATLTVTRGVATISLASSASPVLVNSNVSFVAHVKGGSPAPSGTVQFTSGSTNLGSVPLNATGTAGIQLSTLPAGSQTITAVYSGDANYAGASASLTEVVTDFTLALTANSPAKQTVLAGKVASYQFTVAPTAGSTLAGDVTFALSGLPAGATYTITPSSVAGGSGTTNITLAVTAPVLKSQVEGIPSRRAAKIIAAALLLLPFHRRLRRAVLRTRGAGLLLTVLFATAALLSTTGCGAGVGYYDGAQQSTSTLTLTATSGSLSHSATVTLEVQ